MNCRDWEEKIALYLGGDLPPAESAAVERHLADCAGCQVFSSGLKQSLDLLREAHREPLAEAHFAAVRSRVLSELERRRRPAIWRWAWAGGLAAAAAAAALAVTVWLRPVPPPPEIARSVQAPPLLIAPRPLPEPVQAPRPRRAVAQVPAVPVRAVAPAAAAEAQPLVVKLITDDPDVVIYWITDTKGGD